MAPYESDLLRAARWLRQARRLVEQAQALVGTMPVTGMRLEAVRQVLGEIGGDYRDGEEQAFALAEGPR